ncbi:nucleoside diphosphate kinase 3-like [Pyrus ussuriensis x Pyrus communis]|uniref:Nucleoside diphosphate kinase n=1 Tax=Pyrus ussuriensis x Pyrus communis TaxID=2448454 RepID=A0A5N5GZD5_9ROSA|nr:nucleoside diphosphate kinase 3-like [Pyrus ussuriensis x Pyrus communis]
MTSRICRSASRATRSFLSAPKASSRSYSAGRAVATAAAVALGSKAPFFASSFGRGGSDNASKGWISGALAVPAAAYMLVDREVHAAELERTFIAIKPDGVQRGLIAEIISRFERKGFKLVGIKVVVPTKDFAQEHYHDLKERPFFSGLCDFLSSGPVIAMVWEGEGVIKYGRKLIGATDPQKSEPGTIRGDLAVVVGRNIIHGSDGPETAKDEINLWFKPNELLREKRKRNKAQQNISTQPTAACRRLSATTKTCASMQLQRPAPIHIIWKFPSLSRKSQRVFGIVGQFDTGFDLFLHPCGIASPLPGLSSGSGIEEQDLIKKQKKEAKAKEIVEKKKRKEGFRQSAAAASMGCCFYFDQQKDEELLRDCVWREEKTGKSYY